MEESKSIKGQKGLLIILIVLCIVIVVLVTAILIINFTNNQTGQTGQSNQNDTSMSEDANTVASSISDKIRTKMETDPNYNLSEAEQEFESEITNSNQELKINIAIAYANFIYEETEDVARAINILEDVEQSVNERNRVDYYVALSYFYNEAGDEESANYYDNLIKQFSPDKTGEIME